MKTILPLFAARSSHPALGAVGFAALVTAVTWLGEGPTSLPGLALIGLAALAGSFAMIRHAPAALVVVAPALMPLPLLGFVFPYELAFYGFAFLLVVHALRTRSPGFTRLESFELANLLFLAWAVFTGFWSDERMSWMLSVRRLLGGMIALFIALRMARVVPRPLFEIGLAANALALSLAALIRRSTLEQTESRLQLSRASATDLGWGTANAIATLLLLVSPALLVAGWRERERWIRWITWPALGLTAVIQFVIASRAAVILFALGILLLLGSSWGRRRWTAMVTAACGLGALLLTPFGIAFLERFSNPRDLGSMAVRVWYFRESWQRTLDNFPWGMGAMQGLHYPDRLQNIDPHNYWLAVGSELGLPGLVLWLAVLVFMVRRLTVMARTPGWEPMGRALLFSFWLSQLHTLVEPTFQGPQYQFLFFWLMGGFIGYHALDTTPRGAAPGQPAAERSSR